MTASISSLLSLPPEIIYDIADFLPPDGILALKLTHSILNATLPLAPRLKNADLSDCARLAIRTYLSRQNEESPHIRCIVCKKSYPPLLFNSSSSPACQPLLALDGSQREVVELPTRFCSWHVSRLARIIPTGPGGRNEWVSSMAELCVHCGLVRGWQPCDCKCDSCGVRPVRTYTRYLNNETECKSFKFWRKSLGEGGRSREENMPGRLFVEEKCASEDEEGTPSKTFAINLTVHFEYQKLNPETDYSQYPRRSRDSHIKAVPQVAKHALPPKGPSYTPQLALAG